MSVVPDEIIRKESLLAFLESIAEEEVRDLEVCQILTHLLTTSSVLIKINWISTFGVLIDNIINWILLKHHGFFIIFIKLDVLFLSI